MGDAFISADLSQAGKPTRPPRGVPLEMTREQCDQALRPMGYMLLSFGEGKRGAYHAAAVPLVERPTAVADTQDAAFAKLVERTADLLKRTAPDLSHLTPRDRLAALVQRHGEGFNAIVAAARDAMPDGDSVDIEVEHRGVFVSSLNTEYDAIDDFAAALLTAVDGAIQDESEDDDE